MNTSENSPPPLTNRLAAVRQQRGLAAAALAQQVGISRQTVYAMEAGDYVPNTQTALRLARALDVTVEDLFSLEPEAWQPVKQDVEMLAGERLQPGQPVQICRVGSRTVAVPAAPWPAYLPPADAVMDTTRRTRVQMLGDAPETPRLLLAGCDPAMSVLARHLQRAGVELVLSSCNSTQALARLQRGQVHLAGSHLQDEATGQADLHAIERLSSRHPMTVITFAEWEEGLVIARGNPLHIRSIADLAQLGIRLMNREPGSGSRRLLDAELHRIGLIGAKITGYGQSAPGHLAAAWHVHSNQADCCLATRAAARLFGLDFLPLRSERYDLILRQEFATLPGMQILQETLARGAFRREIEALGGYDTTGTGRRVM